jgi:xylulokinase
MLGSAILGAVGVGAHPDLRSAIGAMVRTASVIGPDPANAAVYDERFRTYASLYPVLREAMHELGREPLPGG